MPRTATVEVAVTGGHGFRPRLPWLGGDLQTVRNALLRVWPSLDAWPGERLLLPLGDGDRLMGSLHRPAQPSGRPLAVLIHGLSGSEDSIHVRATARLLLQRGHPVLRLNLRGAGPSVTTCRGLYHAAATGDLAAAIAVLPEELARHGVVAVGYSLGGNLLLRMLGEMGGDGRLVAAAAVSAPIDVAATAERFHRPRNRLYMRWLLGEMKQETLAPGRPLTEGERRVVAEARTIIEFDDHFVAPRAGYSGVADYYARASSLPMLAAIRVPTLVIHADNDPWIAPEPYRTFDWTRTPALTPLITPTGGHVGFHGRGDRVPWHNLHIARFFEDVALASA